MTENSDKAIKFTIKVRLSDEDYQDITIEYSDESYYMHKRELFYRKIAPIIGLPVEYINDIKVVAPCLFGESGPPGEIRMVHLDVVSYMRRKRKATPLVDDYHQVIDSDDCFFIRPYIQLAFGVEDDERPFYFYVDLFSTQHPDIHPTECTPLYCHTTNTRAWVNKYKEILLNTELVKKIATGRRAQLWGRFEHGRVPDPLVEFNVAQYDTRIDCSRNATKHKRPYLPHRG